MEQDYIGLMIPEILFYLFSSFAGLWFLLCLNVGPCLKVRAGPAGHIGLRTGGHNPEIQEIMEIVKSINNFCFWY